MRLPTSDIWNSRRSAVSSRERFDHIQQLDDVVVTITQEDASFATDKLAVAHQFVDHVTVRTDGAAQRQQLMPRLVQLLKIGCQVVVGQAFVVFIQLVTDRLDVGK